MTSEQWNALSRREKAESIHSDNMANYGWSQSIAGIEFDLEMEEAAGRRDYTGFDSFGE